MNYEPTIDGRRRITVACHRCKGCGEADASGFPCPTCGGQGYTVHKKPARDYEAAGRRAFEAGRQLSACPYRYGWPFHGWTLGWLEAAESKRAANVAAHAEP
jgi:hypothetical protein